MKKSGGFQKKVLTNRTRMGIISLVESESDNRGA